MEYIKPEHHHTMLLTLNGHQRGSFEIHEVPIQVWEKWAGFSVQFSHLADRVVGGNMWDDPAEILSQSLSALGHCKQFWHEQECPLYGVVHPAFSLRTSLNDS